MISTGQDCDVSVYLQGEVQLSFRLCTTWSWDNGITEQIVEYQGHDTPTVRTIKGAEKLSLTVQPDSADFQNLVDLEIAKAKGDADALEKRVSVAFTVDFKNGDRMRRQLVDARLTGGGISSGSRTDIITSAVTFTAPKSIRIA